MMKSTLIAIPFFLIILSGCASGLYTKATPQQSMETLLNISKEKCSANLTEAEKQVLYEKMSPSNGVSFTESEFQSLIFPSEAERNIINKVHQSEIGCRPHYVQWARDYAPKAYNLVNDWYSRNVEISRQLSTGLIPYGAAVYATLTNYQQFILNLESLEFQVAESRQSSNRALIEAYLGRIGNSANKNTSTDNNNLIRRCSTQGKTPNFGTGGCF